MDPTVNTPTTQKLYLSSSSTFFSPLLLLFSFSSAQKGGGGGGGSCKCLKTLKRQKSPYQCAPDKSSASQHHSMRKGGSVDTSRISCHTQTRGKNRHRQARAKTRRKKKKHLGE
ncbi:hypothetical protein J3F83DRAFT_753718 [Trichoderma novae-zelandiae]